MIPLKDSDFVAWMTNAEDKISTAPTDYGLSAAQRYDVSRSLPAMSAVESTPPDAARALPNAA